MDEESLKAGIYADFEDLYQQKEEEIGIDKLREVERMILIRVVDNKWMDHLSLIHILYQRLGLLFIETELKKVKEYEKESCADNSRK